jgi:hypothetical protein
MTARSIGRIFNLHLPDFGAGMPLHIIAAHAVIDDRVIIPDHVIIDHGGVVIDAPPTPGWHHMRG